MAGIITTPTGENASAEGAPTQPQFVGSATGQPIAAPPAEGTPPVEGAGDPPAEGDGVAAGDPLAEGDEAGAAVVGHGGKEMSPEAISERVERGKKKQLREMFGTDDPDKIKEIVARGKKPEGRAPEDQEEFDRLKRQEEARKRARLTQQQRTDSDLKTKDERIAELEGIIVQRGQDDAVSEQDQIINTAAEGHIDQTLMRHVRRDLASHLTDMQEKNPDMFAKFGPKQLARYFQKYATDNPAFATKTPSTENVEQTVTTPPKAAPVKRQVTTTKTAARPPSPAVADGPGTYKGKVVKPGQPNSMTKQELREYAKTQGHKLNY